MWHLMGVMLSAAGSLRWYRDVVAPTTDFDTLLCEASSIENGSEGLFFLPYLSGERCPHPDPTARACFVGLTLRHGRGHMTRSVLEGVAFGLRDNLDLLRDTGIESVSQVRVSGGGARNPFWRQLLADVLDVSLITSDEPEGAAYGAALLAAVGAGAWPSVTDACSQAISSGETTDPDPASVAQFDALHQQFRVHYPALRPLFRETA
jgi:xylulokinase